MKEAINIMNTMIVEREYAERNVKMCQARLDLEGVGYYKGKIAVYDAYIQRVEILLKDDGRKCVFCKYDGKVFGIWLNNKEVDICGKCWSKI